MSKTTNIRTGSVFQSSTQNGDRSFIPDGSVSEDKLQDLAVTRNKLADSANVFEMVKGGFQDFVDQQALLTATTTTGTPATGRFYSSITNRASIIDLTQDLKSRMGVERIATQNLYQLQNEFGPNGEPVWGVVNDILGQIRLVNNWSNILLTLGDGPCVNANGSLTTNYAEITFYGTGLDVLTSRTGSSRDVYWSVDGGSETLISDIDGTSSILSSRNYPVNAVGPIVSGLTLGVHTVKIRDNATNFTLAGFEILNESSSIKTNPGIAYKQGARVISPYQNSAAYNTGVTGTRGGRIVKFQTSSGGISQVFQAVNASSATLGSADHTNEEVVRTHFWREFGANRADDFSTLINSTSDRAFTLDDGITSLVGNDVFAESDDTMSLPANGGFITLTFVGSGLDIIQKDGATGGADTYNIQIDGGSTIALPTAGNTNARQVKLVSGLPYGIHTVKINRVTATWRLGIRQFIIYQPKKPTIPTDAIELADFNVMADYAATATVSSESLSQGSLYKASTREIVYVGTWGALTLNIGILSGFYTNTTTASSYLEYTFFGAGIEVIANSIGSTTVTIQIDGVAYTGAATARGTSAVWTSGTSTWTVSNDTGGRLQISGLTPGLHKIRVTWATGNFFFHGLCTIPLLYAAKSNIYADYQNTLMVGSNSICDSRKTTPVKDVTSLKKNWAQAIGIASNPTTTSTSFIPCPDMSCTIKTNGGDLRIAYAIGVSNSTPSTQRAYIVVDGVVVSSERWSYVATASQAGPALSDNIKLSVASGTHQISVYWRAGAGTLTADNTNRILLVEEV